MRRSNEEKRAECASIIADREASGASVAAYCRSREIPAWKYHYWNRRLRRADSGGGAGFVEMSFAAGGGSGVWFDLGSGVRLVVERGFDADALRRALAAVGSGAFPC